MDHYTDQEIVNAILNRNASVTKEFLYKKCYPLFSNIWNKYYTDCESPIELINEIYIYILTPGRKDNRSKLQNFGYRCTLTMWLKIVTENYCHQLYSKRILQDENINVGDRSWIETDSFLTNDNNLDMEDVRKIISMMSNQRYQRLIEYRYIYDRTNEETAKLLDMSMENYYNCHKRAKDQFREILRKENLI